jgi:hypothetical protein
MIRLIHSDIDPKNEVAGMANSGKRRRATAVVWWDGKGDKNLQDHARAILNSKEVGFLPRSFWKQLKAKLIGG